MISVIGRLSVGDEIIREVKNLFKFFDSNNNNKLTAVELKSGFERLNENLTFHEVN